jgi:hypothetical protein
LRYATESLNGLQKKKELFAIKKMGREHSVNGVHSHVLFRNEQKRRLSLTVAASNVV